jgi:hypothetical protein
MNNPATPKWSKLFVATLAAPFGALLAVTLVAVLIEALSPHGAFFLTLWIVPLFGLGYTMVFGLPLAIVFGNLLHALLSHFGQRKVFIYFLGGAIGGGLVAGVAFPFFQQNLFMSGVCVVAAAAGMTTFWLIRRPDRDAPNPATPAP